MSTFKLFGIEFDRHQDCIWCKEHTAVFDRVAYRQPCDKCRDSERYVEYKKKKDKEIENAFGQNDALNANKVVAVWYGEGKEVFTNSKGNILSEQTYKERPAGKPDIKL